ncbi:MAG: TonB-dependent receptor [Acidobacteria bacterium]|nr:TonB-dependent receptor [Acidobacteriota bacterium]
MAVRFLSLILLFLVFSSVSPANAQSSSAPVAGQIVSGGGTALGGAEVVLRSSAGQESGVVADVDGQFQFSDVPPGEYWLIATAVGMSPIVQPLTVVAGQPMIVTLVMPEVFRERINVVGYSSAVGRIPGSAQIIASREMQRLQVASDDVHQMLRQIPGLNIQEEDGYGLRPNIGMRGTGTDRSSKITLMEDGVLVAPAPYAAPAAYYSPVPGRMESLEVRKGSSQIKYGPITTGGVLNYVSTAIPSDFRLRANLAAGGDRTGKISVNLGDSYGHFGWLVETFQLHNNGFKVLDGGGDTGTDVEDYLAKLRFNTTPTLAMYQEVEIKVGHTEQVGNETYLGLTDADFTRTPLRRYAASQADVFDSTHEQYQVRHLLARRNWDLTTVGYRNDFSRAWYKLESVLGSGLSGVLANPDRFSQHMALLTGADSAPNALVIRNNNRTYYGTGVQSVVGVTLSARQVQHKIEASVRYHKDEEDRFQQDDAYQMTGGRMILTRAGAPGSQTNQIVGASAVAGFVSDTIGWGDWSFSPGLRYETIDFGRIDYARTDPARSIAIAAIDTSVDVLVPGLGVRYQARPGAVVFGGVHKGFAPPGPGLAAETKAEESVNYELGTRLEHRGVSSEVIGFFNDYSNLLGRDTLSAGGTGEGDLFNGGKARTYGLEASVQWNPLAAVGAAFSLPVRVAYTFTDAEFRNSFQSQYGPWGTVQIGHELPYVPRHQFHASIDVDRQLWRARLDSTYVSRMRTAAGQGAYVAAQSTDAYLVVDLSGEYTVAAGTSLFASVRNLTDATHIVARHPSGVRPGLPRLFMAGLKFDIGR